MEYADRKYTNLSSTETKTNQESTKLNVSEVTPPVGSYPMLPVDVHIYFSSFLFEEQNK